MTVAVYKSTDASAPVLTGQAGSLVTVLDAVLVNGYGAKAAAGWAIPFTGTNKRIYRAPTGGLRGFYRVQDDAPNATFAAGREARFKGSEAASAVDTQTNLFPTAVQLANGLFMRKSAYADATAVPWVCVADDRTCYFFCNTADYPGYAAMMFGEYFSIKSAADNFNGMCIGRAVEQTATTQLMLASDERLDDLAALTVTLVGHYTARSFTEMGGSSSPVAKHGNAAHSAATLAGLAFFPNPVDGGAQLSQVWIHEGSLAGPVIRGRMRGFWHFLHPQGVNVQDGDTFTGVGPLAGKTFQIIKPTSDALGIFCMEISDTWEKN